MKTQTRDIYVIRAKCRIYRKENAAQPITNDKIFFALIVIYYILINFSAY